METTYDKCPWSGQDLERGLPSNLLYHTLDLLPDPAGSTFYVKPKSSKFYPAPASSMQWTRCHLFSKLLQSLCLCLSFLIFPLCPPQIHSLHSSQSDPLKSKLYPITPLLRSTLAFQWNLNPVWSCLLLLPTLPPKYNHSVLLILLTHSSTFLGVPVVVQRKRIRLGTMRLWVWSLALLSGIRIWRCHELWCRLQMRLGCHLAVGCGVGWQL